MILMAFSFFITHRLGLAGLLKDKSRTKCTQFGPSIGKLGSHQTNGIL